MKNKKLLIIKNDLFVELLNSISVANHSVFVDSYAQALEALKVDLFDHVICNYNLTDKDCVDFMVSIKETSSYSSELIVTYKKLLTASGGNDSTSFSRFISEDNFIDTAFEVLSESDKVFDLGSPYLVSLSANQNLGDSFLFSFDQNEILIGLRNIQMPLELVPVSLEVAKDEKVTNITLTGTFSVVEQFDEGDDGAEVLYCAFSFSDQEGWTKFFLSYMNYAKRLNDFLGDNLDLNLD